MPNQIVILVKAGMTTYFKHTFFYSIHINFCKELGFLYGFG